MSNTMLWTMTVICLIPIIAYIVGMRNFKLNTKSMVAIAVFAAISFILSKIAFITYPQGGGISLLPSLPIMIVAVVYGRMAGATTGLIYGLLSLMGGFIVNPPQILLDFILPQLTIGYLSGVFSDSLDSKLKIFLGAFLAILVGVMFNVMSGYIFFADYAPKGMNPFIYTLVYNYTSAGVEGLASSIVLTIIPLNVLRRTAKL